MKGVAGDVAVMETDDEEFWEKGPEMDLVPIFLLPEQAETVQRIAEAEGIPFAAVVGIALKEYVEKRLPRPSVPDNVRTMVSILERGKVVQR